jgi:hypothetical protein
MKQTNHPLPRCFVRFNQFREDYFNPEDAKIFAKAAERILDCGGRAQRRHRFFVARDASKAAWRFASRRGSTTLCLTRRITHHASRITF